LRWAGGKRRLLPELLSRVPKFERYVEPFLGGGALFFALEPERAILADALEPLVTTYRVVRDECEDLIERAETGGPLHRAQYGTAIDVLGEGSDAFQAHGLLLLNRGAFNGLWRVNRAGRFNVPFDPSKEGKPLIPDPDALRACSKALAKAELFCAGFQDTLALARSGDFVYLDPPYDGTFSGYTGVGFSAEDRLNLALELDQLGCAFMLSDADTAWTRSLYGAYRIESVEVRRSISCKASSRGVVGEILVRNY
jgi:DNA adenine methylase